VAVAAPGGGAAGWTGTYRGDSLSVTLTVTGDALGGTLQRGTQTFPLVATVTPTGVAGTFESAGFRYPFTLTRTATGALLKTGGATYALSRTPSAKPTAAKPPTPTPTSTSTPTPTATPPGWRPYKHALGYTVDLPPSWKVQPVDEDTLALIPADLQRGPNGPEEVLLLAGLPAEGVTDPADPRVSSALDNHVRALFPGLSRKGPVEPARLGPHRAAIVRWVGKAPTGIPLQASVVTLIHQNTAVALLIAARPERTAAREETARQILASLRLGRSVIDPALVGFWRREKSYSDVYGNFSSTRIDEMTLRADGTVAFRSQILMSMKGSDGQSARQEQSKGDRKTGRWSATRAPRPRLRLVWNNGTEARYTVEHSGKSLLLIGDGGEKLLYELVE